MGTFNPQPGKLPKSGQLASDRLDSWKEIARYLNRDVRTVQRWEETGGLPVYRRAQGRLKGSPVYAYRSELDAWLRQSPPPEKAELPGPVASTVRKTRWAAWAAVPVVILALGSIAVWHLRPDPSAPPLRVAQLTSYSGLERFPAFSPDGKQLAFSWNGENQDNFDIYVKLLGTGEPLRLTTDPAVDGWPAWSPDGRSIVFARWVRGSPKVEILTTPALKGAERKLLDVFIPLQPGADYFPALCWTADGKFIIGPLSTASRAPTSLALLSVETLESRPLTQPVAGAAGDCCPAVAPDGQHLAFLRADQGRTFNVHVLTLGPDHRPIGAPSRLTNEPNGASNPMWTGDSREVLYIAMRDGVRMLWRATQDGSRPPAQIESVGPVGFGWAITLLGDRLVFGDRRASSGIWQVDLGSSRAVSRVLPSSAADRGPDLAPDGKRLAFVSDRSGGNRIWATGPDRASPADLAATIDRFPGPGRWSPGGDQIIYECQNQTNDDVCVVLAGGGAVRRVTRHPARDVLPSWSRDGKWIYFASNRSGSFQVWKMPARGTDADAAQLTKGGGLSPAESMDGADIYFARELFSGEIWKIPSGGGQESRVGNLRVQGCRSQNFAVNAEGIFYASTTDPERSFDLWLYRFATGKQELIRRIEKRVGDGLSVSRDGSRLLFAASDFQSGDLFMVENFR